MTEPRIVTREEAHGVFDAIGSPNTPYTRDRASWAYTVATEPDRLERAYQTGLRDGRKEQASTEPDRTRAAVVRALRQYGDAKASRIATEIENGAPL